MKELILNIRYAIAAKKYADESEQCRREYYWYSYLVRCQIDDFLARLKFWKRHNDIPF